MRPALAAASGDHGTMNPTNITSVVPMIAIDRRVVYRGAAVALAERLAGRRGASSTQCSPSQYMGGPFLSATRLTA